MNATHLARQCAIQALFQAHFSQDNTATIAEQFHNDPHLKNADKKYFKTLLNGVSENLENIDGCLTPHLTRPLAQVNPVELAILRLAVYELSHQPKVPTKVVINEALELAKIFGAEDSYKYINGVLDNVAKKIRD